ncbi:MAG: hypothetical protein HKP30_16375 [Myxococcales bacterium]|nr:hypothetical protein [Myxococcales bacterium]
MSRESCDLEQALLLMRDPLGRIELAASQLARIETSSVTRDLLRGIRSAVGDLDEQLQEAVGALRAPYVEGGDSESDCGEALRRVFDELAPVFAARSRRLDPPELHTGEVRGDAAIARRAALRLLRGAGRWTGAGGRLRLALLADSERWGVRVAARCTEDAPAPASASFIEARRLARSAGGSLEHESDGQDEARATLWFPQHRGAA